MTVKKNPKLHLLQGTHDTSRHGTKAAVVKAEQEAPAKPTARVPSPPKWLPPEALVEWRRVTKAMKEQDNIQLTDRTMLAQYCFLYAQLAEEPFAFTVIHHGRLESLQVKLGLCPKERPKSAAAAPPAVKVDAWDKL